MGAKVDRSAQMNEARNAMKALNKWVFWQTKWKNLVGIKEGQSSGAAAECLGGGGGGGLCEGGVHAEMGFQLFSASP